jgi:uncharacterized protein (TIGR02284 family)
MKYQRETVSILNQLVRLHYDRLTGYQIAIDSMSKPDERVLHVFHSGMEESRKCISQLNEIICQCGHSTCAHGTTLGKMYRKWMRVKFSIWGRNTNTIIRCCLLGEYVLQKAYETAIFRNSEIQNDTNELIINQKMMLKRFNILLKDHDQSMITVM